MGVAKPCRHCGEPYQRRGDFCSPACKKRAKRRREANLAEDAYNGPSGARRGRVPLRSLTRLERAVGLQPHEPKTRAEGATTDRARWKPLGWT